MQGVHPLKTVCRHLIADFYECRLDVISEVEPVRRHLLEAARIIEATVVAEAFHRFEPHGVGGTVVIEESHLSVHTWPESRYAAVDIATCGGLDPRPGFRYLKEAFGASGARTQEFLRGLPEELERLDGPLPDDFRTVSEIAVVK